MNNYNDNFDGLPQNRTTKRRLRGYDKVSDKNPIVLYPFPTETEMIADGTRCVQLYVAQNLMSVEAVGPVWDMPDEIVVRFSCDESYAIPRIALRLTEESFSALAEAFEASPDARDDYDAKLRMEAIYDKFVKLSRFSGKEVVSARGAG